MCLSKVIYCRWNKCQRVIPVAFVFRVSAAESIKSMPILMGSNRFNLRQQSKPMTLSNVANSCLCSISFALAVFICLRWARARARLAWSLENHLCNFRLSPYMCVLFISIWNSIDLCRRVWACVCGCWCDCTAFPLTRTDSNVEQFDAAAFRESSSNAASWTETRNDGIVKSIDEF